jgi:spermidine/putrescine transport system ATP-binding protein
MTDRTAGGRLQLIAVGKRYDQTNVLEGIELAVEDGEFLTILGPSGSGKTTILRLIGGFTEPSAGRILFDGVDMAAVPIHRRPFNTVFQDYALFPHMTVGQNVGYGLMVRGVAKAAIRARVAEALGVVALDGFADRYPNQLSGGQRQRVALARALICEPKLILLDEPLGALDAELRRHMQEFLKSLQRQVRISFLFVTHDQEEAIAMSDRICVMNRGRVEQIGAPDEIYYRPRTRFVATFFGDNNLLPGSKRGADVITPFGPLVSADPRLEELAEAAPVTIAVRPEALRLEAPGCVDGAPGLNRLPVEVRSVDFIGPTSRVWVTSPTAAERPLLVKVTSRMGGIALRPGDRADLVWTAADCAAIPGVADGEAS